MRKIDLGQAVQLLANVGVLVGIFFLVFEIRINTRATQAQTRDAISEKEIQLYAWQATNPELARVIRKAVQGGYESLDPVESQMWFGYAEAFFREHENALYQFERGLFSAEEFSGRAENMRVAMKSPGWREHWERRRNGFSPSLRVEIDRLLVEEEARD